ncbi:hypothetical protein [Flavobacterium branchiicola]|uniref:Uncharacterized protein n=1 Tax=Flavobacterium branchiicola TaxID=1114875 RepID=A0ABV9PDG2_9FLAO|nr:hypothetical protein [Flavobacterium branchiicola]MBS7254564.1 hypothetical protein [Flavobacterium branchiicola]
MVYTPDIPAEYRTFSRRDYKRIEELQSQGVIVNYSNCIGDSEFFEHTNSFKQNNGVLHEGNIFVIFDKNSEKKIYFENLKVIELKIQEEIELSNINKEVYASTLSKIQNDLAHLTFNDIAVEFINNESIHFALNFDGEKLLMIDKFVDPALHGLSENQIFYSFFINRNLISSNVVEISDFVKKFQSYITL